jgi:hypothetical protein
MRASGWWRHAPFLPLPSPSYWDFRQATALGHDGDELSPAEVVAAARWSVQPAVKA